MEQRLYQGTINPDALADYLVQTFNQNYAYYGIYNQRYTTIAQKVGQGDHLLVQIARARTWSGKIRAALGVSISRVSDGISVSTGQSNWLNLDDPAILGMVIGAVFFPPLIIFPLIRGINNFTFYQDVWNAIDTYCTQVGATRTDTVVAHAVYCPVCGSINEEGAQQCHTCGAQLTQSQQQAPTPLPVPTGERITCERCGATVPAAKYCGNCGSPLTDVSVPGE